MKWAYERQKIHPFVGNIILEKRDIVGYSRMNLRLTCFQLKRDMLSKFVTSWDYQKQNIWKKQKEANEM